MAESLFEKIEILQLFSNVKREKHFSRQEYIIAYKKEDWNNAIQNSGIQLDEDISDHLYHQYGKGALKILELIKENLTLNNRIVDENYFIMAEIVYTLRYELTTHLIDVFCRRTEMSLWIDHRRAPEAARKAAEIMGKEYSWDKDRNEIEIQQYLDYVKKTVSFID